LLVFLYPLVVANNRRRMADLCSRPIKDSWSNTIRFFKLDKMPQLQGYIYRTHKEGWTNLMKLSLFILFIYFLLPQVNMDWFLETYFLKSRENAPITYALYDNFIHLPFVFFFWWSNIYHTYRFYIYTVIYHTVAMNEFDSIPFDECLDYRRRVILFFQLLAAIICFLFLLYFFIYTLVFVGDIPEDMFCW
jgi:hypothetical protein